MLYYQDDCGLLLCGNSLSVMDEINPNSIDMVVTSPPYWALRDYHTGGDQLGQESLFKTYIDNLCLYFDKVSILLKRSGNLWVNLGDTYYGSGKGAGGSGAKSRKQVTNRGSYYVSNKGNHESDLENAKEFKNRELPDRSLCQIPARFAIAMQDRGWILRNDIIWQKPNQMPTSAKNRFTLDYEHFLWFTKIPKGYYFEQQLELAKYAGDNRGSRTDSRDKEGLGRTHGVTGKFKNKRSVWAINTEPSKGNHFAKYPTKLIETPIKSGCPEGGVVLDIFMGSGTTAIVAERLNRKWIGIELNENYCQEALNKIMEKRNGTPSKVSRV